MAIDPKELHIGSHVMVSGVRARIETIGDAHYIGFSFEEGDESNADPTSDWIQPIPITAELLEELGFLKTEAHGSVSVWMRRDIRIDFYGTRITAMVGNDYNKCTINPICFLHELEAFLYLTTKTELIKE